MSRGMAERRVSRPIRRVVVTSLFGVVIALSSFGTPAIAVAPTHVRTIGQPGQAEMYPSGLDVDGAGNVVVADTGNDRVTLYPAGSTTPSWSVGLRGAPVGGSPTGLQNPRDVALDTTYVYVADTDNNAVQVLRKSDGGFVTRFAHRFSTPIGVSVGTNGSGQKRILVSNGGSGVVDVFNASFSRILSVPPLASNAGTRDAATDA